ncbi:MAG: hypothetical protein HYX78_11800 [Armatimonadetes bacterium]|nr:hypothetical protein [Armatimonadota bacterium]
MKRERREKGRDVRGQAPDMDVRGTWGRVMDDPAHQGWGLVRVMQMARPVSRRARYAARSRAAIWVVDNR